MKKKLIPLIFILFSSFLSAEIGDVPGSGPGDTPPGLPPPIPGDPENKQVPIDDGIGILTGIAVSIIIYSQYNPKKKEGEL